MAFRESPTKEDAIDRLNILLGTRARIGSGSSVPSVLFDAATAEMGVSNSGNMPTRGERVAQAAGLTWDRIHWSAGSTVTLDGLNVMIEALERRKGISSQARSVSGAFGTTYRGRVGGVSAPPQSLERNWDALDEATREHQRLEAVVAKYAESRGLSPRSPSAGEPDFDVAWEYGSLVVVVEIKSATPVNHRQQARLGLGQVVEYRTRLESLGFQVQAVVALGEPVEALDWDMGVSAGVLFIDETSIDVLAQNGVA